MVLYSQDVDFFKAVTPTIPIWRSHCPTEELSFRKLLSDDKMESVALFESCRTYGFFLLDLSGTPEGEDVLKDVDGMFHLGEALFDLDIDTKSKYALRNGTAFG